MRRRSFDSLGSGAGLLCRYRGQAFHSPAIGKASVGYRTWRVVSLGPVVYCFNYCSCRLSPQLGPEGFPQFNCSSHIYPGPARVARAERRTCPTTSAMTSGWTCPSGSQGQGDDDRISKSPIFSALSSDDYHCQPNVVLSDVFMNTTKGVRVSFNQESVHMRHTETNCHTTRYLQYKCKTVDCERICNSHPTITARRTS